MCALHSRYTHCRACACADHYTATETFAPYVKAATRDIKAYQAARGYRRIPISYSSSDVPSLRLVLAEYLTCGTTDASIDVFGMNLYSWCGNSSYYTSGYDTLYETFQDSSIPVLFSETGCNTVEPRDFSDVGTMLGPVFQAVFSGAVVYEWTEEANDYGLVNYTNTAYTGFPYTLDDYNALKTVFSQVTPTGTALSAYTPSKSAPSCPTTDTIWSVQGDVTLPTIAGLTISTISRLTTLSMSSSTSSGSGASSSTRSDTGSSATAPISTGTSATAASLGGTPSSVSTQTSLSTGAIAGIAIGGAAVGIALAIGAFLLWRRKKSKRSALAEEARLTPGSADEQHSLQPYDDGGTQELRAELPGKSAGQVAVRQELAAGEHPRNVTTGPMHELDDAGLLELEAEKPLREIDGRPVMSELQG